VLVNCQFASSRCRIAAADGSPRPCRERGRVRVCLDGKRTNGCARKPLTLVLSPCLRERQESVTRRLDFSEPTINEHYPGSIQLSYEYSFGCENGTAAIPGGVRGVAAAADQTLLPLHLSFCRTTLKNEASGNEASGSVFLALRIVTIDPRST
jgi:hypothetical protein